MCIRDRNKVTGYSSSQQASALRELTCHMGSHSATSTQQRWHSWLEGRAPWPSLRTAALVTVCRYVRRLRGAEQGQRAGAVRASAGDGDDEEPSGRAARRLWARRRRPDDQRRRAHDDQRRRGRGLRRPRRRPAAAAAAATRLHRPGDRSTHSARWDGPVTFPPRRSRGFASHRIRCDAARHGTDHTVRRSACSTAPDSVWKLLRRVAPYIEVSLFWPTLYIVLCRAGFAIKEPSVTEVTES